MRDYRRETVEIIKNLNLSDDEISRKLSVSSRSVYRWRKGVGSPHASQFQRLRELAEGTQSRPVVTAQAPPTNSEMMERVMGRLDQLTKQIADLQESDGVIKKRLDCLEAVGTLKKTTPQEQKPEEKAS